MSQKQHAGERQMGKGLTLALIIIGAALAMYFWIQYTPL